MDKPTHVETDAERTTRINTELAAQVASHDARTVAAEQAERDAHETAKQRAAKIIKRQPAELAIEAQTVVVTDLQMLRHLVNNGSAATLSQLDALIVNAEAASAAVSAALKA